MIKQYLPSGEFCRVTFFLPYAAVAADRDVRLLGEFNEWNPKSGYRLTPESDGFRVSIELPVGREYEFRFLIDNSRWENQWDADAYVPTPFGVDNSVVSLSRGPETLPAGRSIEVTAASRSVDDLTKIEGIGPKIASLLNEAGIYTFAQLAATQRATLNGILAAAGPRFQVHTPTTWPDQAHLAAAGDWPALLEFQNRLVGGRLR